MKVPNDDPARLHAALQEGRESLDRGEGVPFDDALADEIKRLGALRRAVQIGIADADNGRTKPFDDALLARILNTGPKGPPA
jgi:predicted transcriptional regulator